MDHIKYLIHAQQTPLDSGAAGSWALFGENLILAEVVVIYLTSRIRYLKNRIFVVLLDNSLLLGCVIVHVFRFLSLSFAFLNAGNLKWKKEKHTRGRVYSSKEMVRSF